MMAVRRCATDAIDRLPYPRLVALALVLFGAINIWIVNRGLWSMLIWITWAFSYANPPPGTGPLEAIVIAAAAFLGTAIGLFSIGVEHYPGRFVLFGFGPLILGLAILGFRLVAEGGTDAR